MTKKELLNCLTTYLTDGQPHTIRIFGHGGSGKSTFARDLLECLNPEQVNLLETDPYILDGALRQMVTPKDFPNQKVTASMPVAHELVSLTRDITALQNGMDILTIDEPWSPSQIFKGEKPILIVKGMSSAFVKAELFDLSIACFTDSETELARRLKRDTNERGRQESFIITNHINRRQQYETHLEPLLTVADIAINQTNDNFIVQFKND